MAVRKKRLKPASNRTIDLIPKCDRPREKMLAKGPEVLSNLELLVVLLGTGVVGRDVFLVAREIASLAEREFDQLTVSRLQDITGIGPARACQLMAALEFSRRFLLRVGIQVTSDADILPLVEELRNKKQEYFLTFTLDGGNYIIEKRTVFIGTLTQTLVHPRDIFADAIADRAAGIIFVHNHPVNDASPSTEDILVTNRLTEVGRLVGISVIDHIIISKNRSFSFRDKGLLPHQ